jgi:hypothetical protein
VTTSPPVKTTVDADGTEEKTAEDATSITKVKAVKKKKPVEKESTITVDEDESEDKVIEQIEKKAGKKLNTREKKKAIEVIKTKKKMIKLQRIDPDANSRDEDGNETKDS